MKILTVIGSPRKNGNTFHSAKKMEEQMHNLGDYEFEYLFLNEYTLYNCKGCFNCVSRGVKYCPLKDDLKKVQNKIEKADGLILTSPVYVMHISALLKNFIDRQAYMCHRPEHKGKKSLVMCTTAGIGMKETLNYMETVLESWGCEVTAKCGLVTAPWPATSSLSKKNKLKLLKTAKKFDSKLKKETKPKISFNKYMSFRIFQSVSEKVKEYMPADYQFYKNKEYYYPAEVGFFTRSATRIMLKIVLFLMRDMGPGKTTK